MLLSRRHLLHRAIHTWRSVRADVPRLVSCCGPAVNAEIFVTCEGAMERLAAELAFSRHPGDCYCLHGQVGAGKSVFSRAFIRAAAEDPYLTVPSPTFLLQLVYEEAEGPPIHHYDLYRLTTDQDMQRLDLRDSFTRAISLVEWPERLPAQQLPKHRLDIHMHTLTDEDQDFVRQQLMSAGMEGLLTAAEMAAEAPHMAGFVLSEDEQEAADGNEDVTDPYTDRRWRRVVLQPVGPAWAERLTAVLSALGTGGHAAAQGVLAVPPSMPPGT